MILLADRGFVHEQLIHYLRKQQWHFRLRLTGDTLVHLSDQQVSAVRDLCPPAGHRQFFHQVALLGTAVGPVHLALACPLDRPDDPWFVVSDEPTDAKTLDEYSLRFDIEEAFLDEKSGGYQIQTSELAVPEALERLLLIIAIATLHLTSIGVSVVQAGKRRWVDTHWDRGLSYLKIGWRWLPAMGLSEAGSPLLCVAAERNGGWVWHVYDDLGDCTLDTRAADRRGVEAAVEVIAQLHTRSAGHPLLPECRLYGGDLGMHFYTANVRDAIHSLESLQPSAVELSPERVALRDRLLARLHQRLDEESYRAHAMAELGGPEVLLHGDLWTTNMLVCSAEDGLRVRLIDWDHAGVGPISYDLSTLLYRFPPPDRHWILNVYHSSLGRLGWRLPSVADLNLLFATAEWARWANRVIWPALAAVEGHHAEWAFDELAFVEQWCEVMTPVLPHLEDFPP